MDKELISADGNKYTLPIGDYTRLVELGCDEDDLELYHYFMVARQEYLYPTDKYKLNRIDRESLSMVHWQRDAMAIIVLDLDRRNRKPYSITVMLLNSNLEIYRKHFPFETFLFLEDGESPPSDLLVGWKAGMRFKTFLRLFDKWYKKANLGMTPVGEPVKILPIFANERQLFACRELFTPDVFDEFFEKPYRVLSMLAAYENDKTTMQGKSAPIFGKHTYTQLAAKLSLPIPRNCRGSERAMHIARVYKKLTERMHT